MRIRLEPYDPDLYDPDPPDHGAGPPIWPHCQTCGRFISVKTVRCEPDYWGEYDCPEGWCSTCGHVYVSWERT